jgi:Uracil DNA glycosylase superfamily
MLYHEHMEAIFVPEAAAAHRRATPEHVRRLPLTVLALDAATHRALADRAIATLDDLAARWLDVERLFDPSRIYDLYCLLFYPQFDPGPSCAWARQFAQAPLAQYQSLPAAFRLDFGPVYYRGRLNGGARVLVIGQDPSTDEILAQRILVGTAGQRTQRLLTKLGVTRSYVMFNTFLYSIFGSYNDAKAALLAAPAANTAVRDFRNLMLDRAKATNTFEAILAFGTGAHEAVDNWPGAMGLTRFDLTHPTATDSLVVSNWNSHLAAMAAAIAPDAGATTDLSPCLPITDPNAFTNIPRKDLPFGIPAFHGTGGGTHSQRNGNTQITWSSVAV